MSAFLSLRGLSKSYPGVKANQNISFDIAEGEIHALLGENGAGKSTLVKMIYGLVRPDSGEMLLRGKSYAPAQPRAARSSGIAKVFQHFNLFDAMTVAENIALGMENSPSPSRLAGQISVVSNNYGLSLDPYRTVGDLSVGERQRVEIVRCLLQEPGLLIMDEPTSVLTPQEVEILFKTLKKLSAEGTAILYISHKLEEIRTLCKKATILRHGRLIDSCVPAQKSTRELAEMMVGASLQQPTRDGNTAGGEVVLQVNSLSQPPLSEFGMALKSVSLTLRAGEILGIAGVAGNGQDELVMALSGETRQTAKSILLEDKPIGNLSINQRRERGLCVAPEERLGHAAAPDMSLIENAYLSGMTRKNLKWGGFSNWVKSAIFAEKIIADFDVRTPSAKNAARSLSGGNLQKFVIGREVLQQPKVFVVNQPTWGVDVQAAAAIRQALLDMASHGASVVVISQDLDELLEIADNFAALDEGRLSTIRKAQGLSIEEIGLMMGGVHSRERLVDVAS